MCLQQSSGNGSQSETYLNQGDKVSGGFSEPLDEIPIVVRQYIERFEKINGHDLYSPSSVAIKGINYRPGTVLVKDFENEEPAFCIIEKLYVANHAKFFQCSDLMITDFNNHIYAFECTKSNQKITIRALDLIYKWPQTVHYYEGKLHVALYNVDFFWC